MKLLLDENFPQKVIIDFPAHSITTIEKAGSKGKKNGELLELMAKEGFDGLITMDQNLARQQNLTKYQTRIYVIKAVDNRPASVRPLMQKLRSALDIQSNEQVVEIE